MSNVEDTHEQKETILVDVCVPGHDPRKETPTFLRTRALLLKRHPRCFICNKTAEEVGHPHEAHHCLIEWSYANAVDWSVIRADCEAGVYGFTPEQREAAKAFDWSSFDPANPYSFVDDMTVNGLTLCKAHHTGKDEGIHMMDHPRWIAQSYLKEGYAFSPVEKIDRD